MNKRKDQNTAGELPRAGREPVAALPEGDNAFGFEGQKRRESRGTAIAMTVMLASFVLAFLLFIAVICLPDPIEQTVPSVTDTEEPSALPSGKQPVTEAGGMTTAELYAACADSVVSILAEGGGGKSVGSGFVLTSDGYLATAHHVVAGAERLRVILASGREYDASVVAGNELTDLALLKIEAEGLEALSFGCSADLRPGERVVAIGTPLSLDYAGSVDTGEVSYHARVVRICDESGSLEKKMTLIQTNTAVNPGNSGCPLLNTAGEVVGVVTMRLGADTTGMAFAIPSDGAEPILSAMREGKPLSGAILSAVSVRAPKLGVVGENAKEGEAHGVRVLRFARGTYDAMNKLKIGDLIVAVGSRAVPSSSELAAAIGEHAPGDTVEITVLRAGQRLTFFVTLGE